MKTFSSKTIAAGNNAKTKKGDSKEYITAIMYLKPTAKLCPNARVAKCAAGCLNTAGRGQMSHVQQARLNKTKRFMFEPKEFKAQLNTDIQTFERRAKKNNLIPCVRLNGTSDVDWTDVIKDNPGVTFYDYTKMINRAYKDNPDNYHLTLSYSEANKDYADSVLKAAKDTGTNIAVVFRTKAIRDEYIKSGWKGFKVIDGDETDLRFTDPNGVVVGLYAKGQAKKDKSGFVID